MHSSSHSVTVGTSFRIANVRVIVARLPRRGPLKNEPLHLKVLVVLDTVVLVTDVVVLEKVVVVLEIDVDDTVVLVFVFVVEVIVAVVVDTVVLVRVSVVVVTVVVVTDVVVDEQPVLAK